MATATHGSGDGNGNLATAVAGLELVTAGGETLVASRGDPDFDGLVVGLGALGAVTRVTLDVEPAYQVRQRAFDGLAWAGLFEHLDEVTAAGYSVSLFTRWGEEIEQVWVKSRVTDEPERLRDDLFGAVPATVDRHPIVELDPVNCTRQLGAPGPWWDRLPHFRMGFTPSSGEELQSEYHLPRRHAVAALQALRALAGVVRPALQVTELRTVAADRLWMSPQYGRDTLSVHFTWQPDWAAVRRALVEIEAALAPFGARPHWGKVFLADAAAIAPLYERLGDFRRLVGRLDPGGVFANDWLRRHVLGWRRPATRSTWVARERASMRRQTSANASVGPVQRSPSTPGSRERSTRRVARSLNSRAWSRSARRVAARAGRLRSGTAHSPGLSGICSMWP